MAKLSYDPVQTFDIYVQMRGSIRATSRETGMSRGAVKYRLEKASRDHGLEYGKPISGGKVHAFKTVKAALPKKGEIKRYVLTSAQNNTDAHVPFFENLVAYAEHVDAQLMVSQFTYNKNAYGQMSVKPGTAPTADDTRTLWYDPIFEPYVANNRIELAPMLTFCGEINVLPTAARPLSGFETYTARSSGIFPHAKMAMESIAGTVDDGAKFNYTTGTATLLNYMQKKAGLQAEFHHTFGAVIAEVNHEGMWWVRQLNADNDGSFYDIPNGSGATFVQGGEVSTNIDVEAVNWGDLHPEVIDSECKALAFNEGGILDTLRPRHQFAHDVLDFRARNHHEIKNPHAMFKRFNEGTADVREEVQRVRNLLHEIKRDFCMTVVVDSNHDNALERWLREADYRYDPANAIFFLECQLDKYSAIQREDTQHHVVREALRREGVDKSIIFLGPDDSFVLCDDDKGGIECGMHGHLGPNGSRGSARGLSRMGRKANTGHTHSAQILDGMYVAGTFTRLRLDYTKGPSSWSHSFIVTYPNGKRAIVTIYNGKWRATPN